MSSPRFMCTLSVAVARSSSAGVAMCFMDDDMLVAIKKLEPEID